MNLEKRIEKLKEANQKLIRKDVDDIYKYFEKKILEQAIRKKSEKIKTEKLKLDKIKYEKNIEENKKEKVEEIKKEKVEEVKKNNVEDFKKDKIEEVIKDEIPKEEIIIEPKNVDLFGLYKKKEIDKSKEEKPKLRRKVRASIQNIHDSLLNKSDYKYVEPEQKRIVKTPIHEQKKNSNEEIKKEKIETSNEKLVDNIKEEPKEKKKVRKRGRPSLKKKQEDVDDIKIIKEDKSDDIKLVNESTLIKKDSEESKKSSEELFRELFEAFNEEEPSYEMIDGQQIFSMGLGLKKR